MTASISRRLILWLAVPLMLLALCGALVHYFNKVAPGVISSDRRLKDAAYSLMARVRISEGQATLEGQASALSSRRVRAFLRRRAVLRRTGYVGSGTR